MEWKERIFNLKNMHRVTFQKLLYASFMGLDGTENTDCCHSILKPPALRAVTGTSEYLLWENGDDYSKSSCPTFTKKRRGPRLHIAHICQTTTLWNVSQHEMKPEPISPQPNYLQQSRPAALTSSCKKQFSQQTELKQSTSNVGLNFTICQLIKSIFSLDNTHMYDQNKEWGKETHWMLHYSVLLLQSEKNKLVHSHVN